MGVGANSWVGNGVEPGFGDIGLQAPNMSGNISTIEKLLILASQTKSNYPRSAQNNINRMTEHNSRVKRSTAHVVDTISDYRPYLCLDRRV
jgi:hypothetical protein